MFTPPTLIGGLILFLKRRSAAKRERKARRAELLDRRYNALFVLTRVKRSDDRIRAERELGEIDDELKTL